MTTLYLWLQNNIDQKLDLLLKESAEPPSKPNIHQSIVYLEQYVFLFIYFLSDTISIFEMINLLLIGTLNTIVLPIRTFTFLISICYATYIHVYCRRDDLNERYDKLNRIVGQEWFTLPIKPALVTLCVYTLLFFGFYFSYQPIIAASLFLTSFTLCLYHYNEMYQFPYGIYLNLFAYKQLTLFTQLLIAQGRIFRLYGSEPRIISLVNYLFSGLAITYTTVYYNSWLRMVHINKQHDQKNSCHIST